MRQQTIWDFIEQHNRNTRTAQEPQQQEQVTGKDVSDNEKLITIYARLLDDLYNRNLPASKDEVETLAILSKMIAGGPFA